MSYPKSPAPKLPAQRPPQVQARADFQVTYGLIPTISILSDACRKWLDENAEIEPWQWFRDDLVAIEPRHAEVLESAMLEAGLVVGERP